MATYRFSPGFATFGFAPPKGAAFVLRVGDLPTQTDVKRRWEDGSIRHAAVHALIPTEGEYPIVAVNPVVAAPKAMPTWPVITTELVVKNADGTSVKYTAPTPTNALLWAADPWFAGQIVSEQRALVVPKAGTLEHLFLRVRYDRRQYFPSGRRVSVAFENCVDALETNIVTYDVTIKVGSAVVFTRTGVSHHAFSRWRPIPIMLDGLQLSNIVPDFEPFYLSRALVRPEARYVLDRIPPMDQAKFDILNIGDMQPMEAAAGGRTEIGPYPAWVHWYLTHKRPEQLAYMLAMGANVSGAWSMHITHPDDRPVTLDNVPDANTWTWGNGTGPKNKKVGRKFGPESGSAHRASLAFVPYLLTCDRFHLDEMRAWSHYALMSWGPFGRRATEGIIAYQQTRGIGWAMRDLSDFLGFAPDTDPDRPYFLEKMNNNLRELDIRAAISKDSLGSMFPTGSYIPTTAATIQSQVPMWQNDYLTFGLHHALKNRGLGPDGLALLQKLVGYRMAMATAPGFKRSDLSEYWYYVTKHEAGNPSFADFAEMWRYNYEDIDPATNKPRKLTAASILPGYAGELRIAAIIAMDLGLSGAAELYDFVEKSTYVAPNVPPTAGMKEYFGSLHYQPFAIAPYPVAAPSPVPEPTPTPTPTGWHVTEQGAKRIVIEEA